MAVQRAEGDVKGFKETTAQNLATTNGLPTMQDLFVGIGQDLRAALQSSLSPQERKASREAATQAMLHLVQAAGQVDLDSYMENRSPSSPEEVAELKTCLLRGFLELSQEQFANIRDALVRYERQAQQENPQYKPELPDEPQSTITPQVLEQIQPLLSAGQTEAFKELLKRLSLKNQNGATGASGGP